MNRRLFLYVFTFTFFLQAEFMLASEVKALSNIGKVWGFLKYHHPKVAQKNIKWDYVLIETLSDIDRPIDQNDFRKIIDEFLQTVGPISDCQQCPPNFSEATKVNLDLSWIDDGNYFSKTQSEKLKRIRDHFQPIRNAYNLYLYELRPNSHGLEFVLDDTYEDIQAFEYTHRLLTLFHFWNVIEYYYPYKYQSNPDWAKTLEEAIPIFLDAESEHEFQLAMLWLSRQINDSHAYGGSTYLTENYLGRLRAPFKLRLLEDSIVSIGYILSDSLAVDADIRLGDQLIELNAKPIWEHIHEKSRYTAGGNKTTFFANCLRLVLRDTLNSMILKIKRDGKILTRFVQKCKPRQIKYPIPRSPHWRKLDDKNNIIFCRAFTLPDAKETRRFIGYAKNAKGIILDLRPFSGMRREVFNELVEAFCPRDAESSKIFQPSEKYPGITEFLGSQTVASGRLNKKFQKKPVVLIVGENAISLDEFRIMILQTNPNTYTIGSPTSGALADKGKINMPGGFTTYFTQKGMAYPDGTSVFGSGIKLDERVELKAEDIQLGTDPLMERAIEFLKEQLSEFQN